MKDGVELRFGPELELDSSLGDRVEARDPVVFGSVAFLLAATATIASYLPARRCLDVDDH